MLLSSRTFRTNLNIFPLMQKINIVIAQANAILTRIREFENMRISCRYHSGFIFTAPENLDYMDVAPHQVVGISAALIPFLEHDDANRALMGSNMMAQAVPLVRPEIPIVSTGMEPYAALDSGQVIVAEADGDVISVTGSIDCCTRKRWQYPHLQFAQISTLEPVYLHRPAPGCNKRPGHSYRGYHCRLFLDRKWQIGAWPKCHRRFHVLGRCEITKMPLSYPSVLSRTIVYLDPH